jgi:hypothetical protein
MIVADAPRLLDDDEILRIEYFEGHIAGAEKRREYKEVEVQAKFENLDIL